jgi:hypothetical protein
MMCAGWMRFRASLMAIRRTSWIDQRINDELAMLFSALRFFWRRSIGAMADDRHHGEGEHHQGNVAVPAMPGSALVVIETKLVLRSLKAVLDRPPMAFDRHQCFDGCCRWAPGGEEGEIAIGDTTTDQQTSRPKTVIYAVKVPWGIASPDAIPAQSIAIMASVGSSSMSVLMTPRASLSCRSWQTNARRAPLLFSRPLSLTMPSSVFASNA